MSHRITHLLHVDREQARREVDALLEQSKGNRSEAARIAGVSRRTLVGWLGQLGKCAEP